MFDGFGELFKLNKSVYIGYWKENMRDGYGSEVELGREHKGVWKMNTLVDKIN